MLDPHSRPATKYCTVVLNLHAVHPLSAAMLSHYIWKTGHRARAD